MFICFGDKMLDDEGRVYLKRKLDEAKIRYLLFSGVQEYRQMGISGKKEVYLVCKSKEEESNHVILTEEIANYLKKFSDYVEINLSDSPDIIFDVNGEQYAIEVENERIKDREKFAERVRNLKREYGKRWFFFITNRNQVKAYRRFGVTHTKRNIKAKIKKTFRNSKK
jgi:hypothetical protein